MGGSRCSSGQHICNLLIVWICTGLWHGSTLNYLLWGLSLFGLIVLEKRWTGAFFQRHGILCRFYMIPACLLTWMLFAIPDLHQLWTFAGRLFTEYSWSAPDFQRHLQQYGGYLARGHSVGRRPIPSACGGRLQRTAFGTIVLVIIFWAAVYAHGGGPERSPSSISVFRRYPLVRTRHPFDFAGRCCLVSSVLMGRHAAVAIPLHRRQGGAAAPIPSPAVEPCR